MRYNYEKSTINSENNEMKIGLIAHPEELTKGEIAAFRAAGADVPGLHPVGGNKATSSLETCSYG